MRYQLFALVHGRLDARQEHAAARTVPAVVEYPGQEACKRVVAVVDAAHELSGDEVTCTASMLCSQLQRAFSQHGLTLSRPELVPAG
jgi:hypothetical protein